MASNIGNNDVINLFLPQPGTHTDLFKLFISTVLNDRYSYYSLDSNIFINKNLRNFSRYYAASSPYNTRKNYKSTNKKHWNKVQGKFLSCDFINTTISKTYCDKFA